MSEMKLRVARRLWNAQHPLADWDSDAGPSKLERVKMLNLAQIAVEAMREPTDGMMAALQSYAVCAGYIQEGWAAAMNAALKD